MRQAPSPGGQASSHGVQIDKNASDMETKTYYRATLARVVEVAAGRCGGDGYGCGGDECDATARRSLHF